MTQAESFSRSQSLASLAARPDGAVDNDPVDVLVIGGGITGAGVALDAAARGLTVVLVDKGDFASGTSSKSSKLIHGGLRYLQQGDVRLVYQALRERKRLRRNAPHLVTILPFMIPILSRDGVVSKKIARALGSAMWMYDLTGGWRIGKLHKRLSADAAFAHLPTMDRSKLSSAYLYYDAEADDARLCLAVLRSAADRGATIANYTEVVGVSRQQTGIFHVAMRDRLHNREFTVAARAVVNAAGVWADDVRSFDEATHPDSIRPAKGVHITVPWEKVRNDIAVVIPVPRDKRSLFVVPWIPKGDGTYYFTFVGTTDTDYRGPLDDPQCSRDDIEYVLAALNASVNTNVTAADITGVWSGLRPLVKSSNTATSGRTADLSRMHKVTTSHNGVVTVTGGKLTTYREMAEDTVDVVCRQLGISRKSKTRSLLLHGATNPSGGKGNTSGTDNAMVSHLTSRFGSDAPAVRALIDNDPSLGEPLVPGLPYLKAEAVYAVTHEMAQSVDDVLSRRTRARLLHRAASLAAADDVARVIAPYLGWDDDACAASVAAFREECIKEDAAGLVAESELW